MSTLSEYDGNADVALWQYALDIYRRPRVAALCLQLQDAEGFDVCLLLTAGWLASQGYRWDQDQLNNLQEIAGHWQQPVLMPLRVARRALKSRDAALYQQAKQVELAVERQLLAELALHCDGLTLDQAEPAACLRHNIHILAKSGGRDPNREPWPDLLQALSVVQ